MEQFFLAIVSVKDMLIKFAFVQLTLWQCQKLKILIKYPLFLAK